MRNAKFLGTLFLPHYVTCINYSRYLREGEGQQRSADKVPYITHRAHILL